jgi:hypothetical protein
MQTFLPYPNFNSTASCLDYRRLGKQRVEAMQIHRIIVDYDPNRSWAKHPAVLMWKGFPDALAAYYNTIRGEWIRRGYVNNMPELPVESLSLPSWMGLQEFHISHQSNLIRKNESYYRPQFGLDVPNDLPYFWPTNRIILGETLRQELPSMG